MTSEEEHKELEAVLNNEASMDGAVDSEIEKELEQLKKKMS